MQSSEFWFCLVAIDDPVTDITTNYLSFIKGSLNITQPRNLKYKRGDYVLLGYSVIFSTAMKSMVFEALFANI